MKSVLISIQPKWCELIASGKKTVEVRKTKPKIDVPFKCYIYCTKGEHLWKTKDRVFLDGAYNRVIDDLPDYLLDGKVIGEFVCKRIVFLDAYYDKNGNRHLCNTAFIGKPCITDDELFDYLYGKYGRKHGGWAWHISNLVIYDKPKELSEFLIDCKCCSKKLVGDPNCWQGCVNGYRRLTRPPQSWCYVEEVER